MNSSRKGAIKTEVKSTAKKAAFSPVMQILARLGYGVRGLIYIIMGLLALSVTLGKGGGSLDQQGAIATIGRQPAGLFLLWVVLLGLVSYSLWGLIRALFDPFQKGTDRKGLMARAAYLFSALAYGYLAITTYQFIMNANGRAQNGAKTQQQSFASIMSTPFGPWLIGIIGLAVIAIGLYQVYQGINSSFDKQFKTYNMNAIEIKVATQLGRFGTAARGLVFALVGGIMLLAAVQSSASKPQGIDAALTALLHLPYGVWILAVVALGLIAFGAYSISCALWFRARRSN